MVYAKNAEARLLIATSGPASAREKVKKRGPAAVQPAGGALPRGVAESLRDVLAGARP